MTKQYDELIKVVDDVERNATPVERNLIDLTLISSSQTEYQKPGFAQLLELAMKIESHTQKVESKSESARTLLQLQSVSRAPQRTQTLMVQQPERPHPAETVKKEISAFADRLETEQPLTTTSSNLKVDDDELVLPKLSVSDQISELERIVEGINQHVFDKQHLQIIKNEAYGLNRIVVNMEKGNDYLSKLSEVDRSLASLRDQLLLEVIISLRDTNV